MGERIEWIDGMKGMACLIVFLGHVAAAMFPNIFFGIAYVAHGSYETAIHNGPLLFFFSSSSMVGVFYFLSGFLIYGQSNKGSIIRILLYKYLKFLPMVVLGTGLGWIVMKLNLVYSIKLSEYSYAQKYVAQYYNFVPKIFGRDGVIVDAFLRSFISSSRYNSTLWFMAVLLWGTLLLEIINKIDKDSIKILLSIFVLMSSLSLGCFDWRIPYLSYIFAGYIINNAWENYNIKNAFAEVLLFVGGCYIIACPGDYAGIYNVLKSTASISHAIRILGIIMVMVSVGKGQYTRKLFEKNKLEWIGKYSFGIYVVHWPIIVSVCCGFCFLLVEQMKMKYVVAGVTSIFLGLVTTVLLSFIYTKIIYYPYMKMLIGIKQKNNPYKCIK